MLAIAAALLVGMPAATPGDDPAAHVVTITKKDDNKDVNLHVGDELVLKLETNPSTGYHWEVVRPDEKTLKPIGKPTVEEVPGNSGVPGRVQVTVFRFQVLRQSPGKIELEEVRPFGVRKPISTFSSTLQISAAPAPSP